MSEDETAGSVLVTGASGGLGSAIVQEFAGAGWRVAAGYCEHPPSNTSGEIWPVRFDVSKPAEVEAATRLILDRWKHIDVLVNNAGQIADCPVWQITAAAWDALVGVNLKGPFLCSKAVLPHMIRRRDGHIVNIGSFSARSGPAGQTHYASTKAGLLGLTQSMALEVGSRNVRINAVLPGFLRTRMTSHLTADQMRAVKERNALGRLNEPDEVARFIRFLVSTRNISGQIFQLDSRVARWT